MPNQRSPHSQPPRRPPARTGRRRLLLVAALTIASAVVVLLARTGLAAPDLDPNFTTENGNGGPSAVEASLGGPTADARLATEAVAEPKPSAGTTAEPQSPPPVPRDHLLVRVIDGRTLSPVADAQVGTSARKANSRTPIEEHAAQQTGWFDLQLRLGQTATTDANGYAAVAANGWFSVAARKGELFGTEQVDLNQVGPDGFELRIAPCRSLVVHVVDAVRQPQTDVPLGLLAFYPRGEQPEECTNHPLGCTDATGALTVRLDEFLRPGSPPHRIELYVRAPGLTDTRVTVSPDRLEADLILPAHGSLRVRGTDRDGRSLGDAPAWWVGVDGESKSSTEATPPPTVRGPQRDIGIGGEVVFPYIALGLKLNVHLRLSEFQCELELDGPVRSGQEVVQAVSLANPVHFALRGRLLAADGTPLAAAEGQLRTPNGSTRATLRTDADGRFAARFLPVRDETATTLRVTATLADRPPSWLEPIAMRLGEERDLGDLRLADAPLIARGTIVEERPRPPDLKLWIEAQDNRGAWIRPADYRVTLATDDTFAIHRTGPADGRRLRLRVAAPSCQPIAPVDIAPGQDLRIVLRAGPHFLARLQLERGVAWFLEGSGLDLFAIPDEGDSTYLHGKLLDGEWVFESFSLKPGIYRLEIETGTATNDLGAMDGVRVMADEPPDARLLPWDLRSSIQLLTVRARSPEGRTVDAWGEVYRRRELAGDWENCESIQGGIGQCLAPATPSDLFVALDGHGVFHRRNVMGTVNLTVPEPIVATIQLDGLPKLLDTTPLRIEAAPAQGWATAKGMPEWADPILDTEWDVAKNLVRLRLAQPVDAVLRFVLDANETVVATVPVQVTDPARTMHLSMPAAAVAALAPWFAPK